jgi:hypothetical protein
MNPDRSYLLLMGVFYLITISVETPILMGGLSKRHSMRKRIFAGIWLTACTYPIVWIVLPVFITDRYLYLAIAETFAPAAECLLFWISFGKTEPRTRPALIQDMIAIVVANLASFGAGLLIFAIVGEENVANWFR